MQGNKRGHLSRCSCSSCFCTAFAMLLGVSATLTSPSDGPSPWTKPIQGYLPWGILWPMQKFWSITMNALTPIWVHPRGLLKVHHPSHPKVASLSCLHNSQNHEPEEVPALASSFLISGGDCLEKQLQSLFLLSIAVPAPLESSRRQAGSYWGELCEYGSHIVSRNYPNGRYHVESQGSQIGKR